MLILLTFASGLDPPSAQPSAALQSWNAAKLVFFGDPLVQFIAALYPKLVVLALERQKLRHLVDAICPTTIERPRGEAHRLAYFEFVILHRTLPILFTWYEAYRWPEQSKCRKHEKASTEAMSWVNCFGIEEPHLLRRAAA
jgi:hypothetical protein